MLYVVGRWGDGTSLLAEIIRRHGFYFGQTESPEWIIPDRNKHGVLEDLPSLEIFRREADGDLPSRLDEIRYEAELEGLRPALKMPWILVRRDLWQMLAVSPDTRAVFIERPSKQPGAYTMHREHQPAAMVNFPRLRDMWRNIMPTHDVRFESLIERPEAVVRPLADFLGVPFEPSAVDAIDPDWVRNKP